MTRNILITGGTGSLGTALALHLQGDERYGKKIIYSRRWAAQHELREKLNNDPSYRYIPDDILDQRAIDRACEEVDDVIHCAAMKSVPDAEYNPTEAVDVNITGTRNVLDAARAAGVKKVMVISSDKSVSAINAYGASKMMAEKLAVAYNSYGPRTSVACSRYANVLGSTGSVIPIFQRQAPSGEITITNPLMTRLLLPMSEAIALIMGALDVMQGGEVFVPKTSGASIGTIAEAVAPNAKRVIIGERPGEKLHEVMISKEEFRTGRVYDQGWAYVIYPQFHPWDATYQTHGKQMPSEASYTSLDAATGPHRLRVDDIRRMIGDEA